MTVKKVHNLDIVYESINESSSYFSPHHLTENPAFDFYLDTMKLSYLEVDLHYSYGLSFLKLMSRYSN